MRALVISGMILIAATYGLARFGYGLFLPQLTEAFAALQKRAEEKMTKVSEDNAKAGKKFLEENGKKPGVITTASGLQYEVVKKADGPQPKPTDVVTVHYEGKLVDGTVFDSSIKRGTPIDLPVNGVIDAALTRALTLHHQTPTVPEHPG